MSSRNVKRVKRTLSSRDEEEMVMLDVFASSSLSLERLKRLKEAVEEQMDEAIKTENEAARHLAAEMKKKKVTEKQKGLLNGLGKIGGKELKQWQGFFELATTVTGQMLEFRKYSDLMRSLDRVNSALSTKDD
jgi:hypothetical protein